MGKAKGLFHHKWRGQRITKILSRDGNKCPICTEPLDRHIKDSSHPHYITFDHILPRSRGGLDTIDNLQLAHLRCNLDRGNDPILPVDEEPLET